MSEEQISLDRYLRAVWRAKWFIIIVTLATAGAIVYLGLREPTLYTAEALIEVGRVWKEPLEDTYTTAETASSGGFLQALAQKIGVKSGYLKRSIKADTVRAGPRRAQYPILVRITAQTESFDESQRLAQAVADEIIARHDKLFEEALAPHRQQEQRLTERVKQAAGELALKLESELDQVRANNASPVMTERTHLLDAVAQGETIRPSPWRRAAGYALIAAMAAIAAAILFDLFKSIQPSSKKTSDA
ncbi:MAG: Wzz/FepE/Etk N-terminal domain-containing protein [Acidobacteriota bacterium]